jgi:glyoxylase-like metal-dependent hydrolase (beta-lactamase superfamily II)
VPGHSKGSTALYAQGILFSGDTLFRGSIGRTDLYLGNFDELIHSIKTSLYTLPEDTIVYPGHGFQTTINQEKKYNPFVRG